MYSKSLDLVVPVMSLKSFEVGPALEAFGDQRIIFGSSSSLSSHEKSTVWDWYELARESFTELGIGQEGIDAIFCENAKQVYGSGQ